MTKRKLEAKIKNRVGIHGVVDKVFEPASKDDDEEKKVSVLTDTTLKKLELEFNPMEEKRINV